MYYDLVGMMRHLVNDDVVLILGNRLMMRLLYIGILQKQIFQIKVACF